MNTIKHVVFYAHPAEDVWKYITQPELIKQWLMESDFKPVLGHEFQFRTTPLPAFGFDGNIYCKVTELEPCKRLTYTWKGGPGNGEITLDSVVSFTLVPKDNGTEMTLEHSGFTSEQVTMFTVMGQGWLRNINSINDLLTTAK
jgi:uncharacterized protein YndB with AHSA1/START domain